MLLVCFGLITSSTICFVSALWLVVLFTPFADSALRKSVNFFSPMVFNTKFCLRRRVGLPIPMNFCLNNRQSPCFCLGRVLLWNEMVVAGLPTVSVYFDTFYFLCFLLVLLTGLGDPFGEWIRTRIGSVWSVLVTRLLLVFLISYYCTVFLDCLGSSWRMLLFPMCCRIFFQGRLLGLFC